MFEDPSFFVALSFIGFCLFVYVRHRKTISKLIKESVASRLYPTYHAKKTFKELEQSWHHAHNHLQGLTNDIKNIQHHYEQQLQKALQEAIQNEKTWMELRKQEIKSFHLFQEQKAKNKALQHMLDEFIHESNKQI